MAKQIEREDHNGCQSLTEELITDILSRLPVASVMICKCVCKAWNSLITNNYFAKLHCLNNNPSSSSSHILIETYNTKRYLLNVDNGKLGEIVSYPHIEDKASVGNRTPLVSNYDGLICFANAYFNPAGPVIIYNPLISGDYVCLPESTAEQITHNITLGFDHSVNKYKVVKISIYDDSRLGCEVITIGKDVSWRRVAFPNIANSISCRGICHHGSIFWPVIQRINTTCILEFDLTKEEFFVISFPNSIWSPLNCYRLRDHWLRVQLHSLGGYLSITKTEGRLVHMWRLVKEKTGSKVIEYRKTKIESPYKYAIMRGYIYMDDNEDLLVLETRGGIKPAMSENGERIRALGTRLTCYRPASEKNTRFKVLPAPANIFSGENVMWCFKPSLISIKMAMHNHL